MRDRTGRGGRVPAVGRAFEDYLMRRSHVIASITVFVLSASVAAAEPVAYPAKGQSSDQQNRDEYECHQWAQKETGVDPVAVAEQATTSSVGSPRWVRIFRMTTGSSMVATTRMRPPHRAQANTSTANMWRNRSGRDQVRRAAGGPPRLWRRSAVDPPPGLDDPARSDVPRPSHGPGR